MNTHHLLPEHIARSILARATELDAQSPAISTEELRAIAAELNVSEASLDTALKEYQAVTASPPATRRRGALGVAALGLPMGLAGGALLSTATFFTAPSIWLLLTSAGLLSSTGLIVLQSKRPAVDSYVLQNTILWGGIAVGALSALAVLGNGPLSASPWLVVLFYGIKHWLTSTILGSAGVTAVLRADSGKRRDPDMPVLATAASEPSQSQTSIRRLLDWLKGPFTVKFNTAPGANLRRSRSAPIHGASA